MLLYVSTKNTPMRILQIFFLSILFFSCQQSKVDMPQIKIEEYNIYCENSDLEKMFNNYKSNN